MHQQNNTNLSQQEGRIDLALQAYTLGYFRSIPRAVDAFNVRHQRLYNRLYGITLQPQIRLNCLKLTATEEQTIVQYILNLDSQGFAPQLYKVADIADKLLTTRGGIPVGKNWPRQFVSYTEELKMAFNQVKDHQRILQKDPKVINAWFKLVRDIKIKYGVYNNNIHNFNKTGFQMGIISSIKVVIGLKRRTRPNLIQPGDQEWVTVIQSICATGYTTPPFIIYKGRVHISTQYKEADIPYNQKLSVSKNGQTNNALSLKWLKHFNKHTKTHQVGLYRLLILNSHKSHLN